MAKNETTKPEWVTTTHKLYGATHYGHPRGTIVAVLGECEKFKVIDRDGKEHEVAADKPAKSGAAG